MNARSAYRELDQGPARSSVPAETQRARTALELAENSFQVEGASERTRQLASEAERSANMAQATCAARVVTEPKVEVVRVDERLQEVLTAVPGTVMFEFDKSELLPAAKERLDQLADALTESKSKELGQTLIIEGHADAKGPAPYNQELSERRAKAVEEYLTSRGYDPNLVQVRALGEEAPFTSDATPEGRANNRRVEIKLGPKKSD